MAEDIQLRLRAVMDVGDVVSNVGTIQKSLNKLKLPEKLGDNLNKNIAAFYKEYDNYQKRISGGIKTQADFTAAEKSLNRMKSLYSSIGKDLEKTSQVNIDDLLKFDGSNFNRITDKMKEQFKNISNVKIDKNALLKPFEEIRNLTKSKTVVGDDGILNKMLGHIDTGDLAAAKKDLADLLHYAERVATRTDGNGNLMRGSMGTEKFTALKSAIAEVSQAFDKAEGDAAPFISKLNELEKELDETRQSSSDNLLKGLEDFKGSEKDVEKVTDSLRQLHEQEFNFNRQAQDIDRQIQSYFGLSQMIRKVGEIARDAFATVKELDAAMVETAVVTNFSVGDMWDMLPTYTANANQLGSTIKDVYEAATLYYQQGLNQAQSMGLANETLKMARIGGLQAAEATNMMTAALRGFNMEINQVSAKRINDVYSELAAITAADTKEIGSAMERTASIANSANMQFETTSAFLAQMIETTREAPENLGTAMKTIIARFQEMKQDPTKLVDSEGVALDANKIDTALKTIGVDLKNQKGEFRDLDTVFLEISEKWNSLTQGQQRYIATIAAGSRQQSRFIAMMQNYERVKELVDAANNSAGASQKQFEKTLDSMNSKLNKLKNAWDQFTMGLMNNQLLKGGVDALTGFFTVVNKIFNVIAKPFPDPFGGLIKSAVTLVSTLGMLQLGKKSARGMVMGGIGWWKDEGGFAENFKKGWGPSGQMGTSAGQAEGQAFNQAFKAEIKKGNFKDAFNMMKAESSSQYQNTYQAAFGQFSAQQLSADWSPQIEAELRSAFTRACAAVDERILGEQEAQEFIDGLIKRMKSGELSAAQAAKDLAYKTQGQANVSEMGVNKTIMSKMPTKETKEFGDTLKNAGSSLQLFGSVLQSTPLAPFGMLISTIGTAMMGLGGAAAQSVKYLKTFTTATKAAAAGEGILAIATTGLRAGFKALWAELLASPLVPVIAGILALVGAIKLIDVLHVSKKEELEATTDAAAKASEAFDSAKQETSELNDAIDRVRENESAFDNLAVGTAEFNEQLVTANEQITKLISKYPMLNNPDYLTTDKNGLMHINESGLEAVKQYQKELQARASAVNIIQSADLARLENEQKAFDKRQEAARLRDKEDKDRIQNLREEANLLDQRAKAETDMARLNAIRTTLNGKEIHDVEAISAVYASLYETKRKAAETEVNALDKNQIRQNYADFHGYKYDKSTKKITDQEGNEVTYDDAVLKDEVIEQTVLLDFEENADSLDTILSDLNSKFNEALIGDFKNSGNFISDLLSSNVETDTDLIEKVLQQPQKLQDVVNTLSEKEVAAILGISAEEINNTNFDSYKDQVVDLFTQKATDIATAQYDSYSELAGMMAQSSFETISEANKKTNQDQIKKEIQDLTTEQANTLSTVGQLLEEKVGSDTMDAFITKASDIYLGKSEATIKELDGLLEEVNWESPASRLEYYNKAIQSNNKDIQDLGTSMRNSVGEANLLGEAFDEFLGGDWEELSANADNFKNSLGEIDATGILEASQESKTLKSMLDSGEASASGLAKALQAVDSGAISQVDGAVLQLLSSIDRLNDTAEKAHRTIENFDAGIDFGEGEDFVKENAEKFKEYADNGEWGNQQLQNYIKLAAGTDRWNKALAENNGNVEAAGKSLQKYVTTFSDGFGTAWSQMIEGKAINGKKLADNINEKELGTELANKFKQVEISSEDGLLDINIGDLTTDELTKYFEEVYGVSKEYAELLMQDLANYNATIGAELQANDLQASLQSGALKDRGQGDNLVLTDVEYKALEAAGSLDKVAQAAGTTTEKLKENQFQLMKDDGETRRDDWGGLLKDYAKVFKKTDEKGLTKDKSLQNEKGQFDLGKLVKDFQSKGFDQEQQMRAAWEAYQANGSQETLYDGMELKGGIDSFNKFSEEIDNLTNNKQWVTVGEAIAQGIISYLNKNPKDNQNEKPGEKSGDKSGNKSDEKPGEKSGDKSGNKSDEKPGEKSGDKPTSGRERREHGEYDTGKPDTSNQPSLKESAGEFWGGLKEGFKNYGKWLDEGKQEAERNKSQPQQGTESTTPSMGEMSAQSHLQELLKTQFSNLFAGISPESLSTPEMQGALNSLYRTALTPKTETLTQGLLSDFQTLGINVEDAIKAGLVVDKNGILTKATEAGKEGGEATEKGLESGVNSTDSSKGQNAGKKKGKEVVEKTAEGAAQGASEAQPKKTPKKPEKTDSQPKENTYTIKTEDKALDDTQKKLDTLKRSAKEGATVTIHTPGASNLTKAANAAKKLANTKENKTISVKTGKVDTSSLKSAKSSIDGTTAKIKVSADTKSALSKAESARKTIDSKSATINVSTKVTGQNVNIYVTKHITEKGASTGGYITSAGVLYRAKGGKVEHPGYPKKGTDIIPAYLTPGEYVQNRKAVDYFGIDFMRKINHRDLSGALQSFGSAAKGRYGTIGPKDKGGLTLTGEEGFEVAWIPSENRSMILGTNGPQMVDLPNDAIVYTHKQSKDILKNTNGINAGSHSNTTRRIYNPPNTQNSNGNSGKGKGKGKGSGKGKQDNRNTSDTANNNKKIKQVIGKVSVWWENQTRRVEGTQRKVDKLLKAFEKEAKRLGGTSKSINDEIKKYSDQLNRSINLNKKSETRAKNELKRLDKNAKASKRTISYEQKVRKKGKKNQTENKTVKKKVSLSGYIDYDKDNDTYVINQKAINKAAKKNKNRAKAIKEAAEKEINERISKRNTAKDNIEKAREALDKLADDVYETFYKWEKSINNIYLLTQKLEILSSRAAINSAKLELQFSKLRTGAGSTNQKTINSLLSAERNNLVQQAKARTEDLKAKQIDFNSSLLLDKYINDYKNNKKSPEALGELRIAKKSLDFLDSVNLGGNNFDYTAAVNKLNKVNYNETTYNEIKSFLDKIFEKQNDLLNAEEEAYKTLQESYDKLEEMQTYIADFEREVLDGLEEQIEDQIDQLDKLNNSLTKALKNLLDEVKRKLDERRKKEDNEKTESDLSKKRQRLALLRADTSGGNAAEIARLETEIADAQQNYQRSLEDQLIERLQNQADKAEEQRQHQIDLLQTQADISKQTGANLALIKKWFDNPVVYEQNIKQAWLKGKNYDTATPTGRANLENEWKETWAKFNGYRDQQQKYQNIIQTTLSTIETKRIPSIIKAISDINKNQNTAAVLRGKGTSIATMKAAGFTAKQLAQGGYNFKSIMNAGYKEGDLRKAGINPKSIAAYNKKQKSSSTKITAKDMQKAGFSVKEAKAVGFSNKQIKKGGYTANQFKAYTGNTTKGAKKAKAAGYSNKEIAKAYSAKSAMESNKKIKGTTVQAAKGISKKKGTTAPQLQKLANKSKKISQKDLAGIQVGKVDVNGKGKGGVIKDSHLSAKGTRVSTNKGSTLYHADWNENKGKIKGQWTPVPISKLTANLIKQYPIDAKQALKYAITHTKVGSKINSNMKSLVKAAGFAGNKYTLANKTSASMSGAGWLFYNVKGGNIKKWNPSAGKIEEEKYNKKTFLAKAKKNGDVSREYAQALIAKNALGKNTKKQLQGKKYGVKKFLTGGLATQTGPAWLDGTPSKPELVLNAQDTKNFLGLKDVLSHAVNSTNSAPTPSGDTNVEVNVNVDHIDSDYDVDRLVQRIKKDIAKDAGYRNVTQVRKLR